MKMTGSYRDQGDRYAPKKKAAHLPVDFPFVSRARMIEKRTKRALALEEMANDSGMVRVADLINAPKKKTLVAKGKHSPASLYKGV